MSKTLYVLVLPLSFAALSLARPSPDREAERPQLAHMVFFTLAERTAEEKEKLVEACKEYLSGHEGTVYFSAGARAEELTREVNDQDFDVALHLVFASREAHDRYQEHPRHLAFIEKHKDSWSKVRVFDSYVAARRDRERERDEARARDVRLPDAASGFAGMIRAKVLAKKDAGLLVRVEEVTREWEASRAPNAKTLAGKEVLIDWRGSDAVERFLELVETGETITVDVGHKEGESLTILELTEEQHGRVRESR